jgi:hypothetical protein
MTIKTKREIRRGVLFAAVAVLVSAGLVTSIGFADPPAASTKKSTTHAAPRVVHGKKAGAKGGKGTKGTDGQTDGGAMAAELAAPSSLSAPSDGGVTTGAASGDGGAKVFRFGELEIEGRLKSPQLVYFLRRVRAEFSAGDLGHRSFFPELSETEGDPSFGAAP